VPGVAWGSRSFRPMTPEAFIAARQEAGLTRADVASKLGLSERTIYRWERGDTEINRATAMALEQILGRPIPAKKGKR